VSDINQNAVDFATKAVTGEDENTKLKRIAASKTVIIENIALDLGLTAREIQKIILDQVEKHYGEKGIAEIVDIDMTNGPTSIAAELAEKGMVEKLRNLIGRLSASDGAFKLGNLMKRPCTPTSSRPPSLL
jgi:hypothetical protein